MATIQERSEATETPGQTRSRQEGINRLLEAPIKNREGARFLIFGRTRWGKSSFAVHLVDAMMASGVASSAIIHDPKYPDRQQYEGYTAHSIDEAKTGLLESSVVVCRSEVGAADTAALARELVSEHGEPTVLLIDETRRAIGSNQRFCDNTNPDGKPGPKNFEWLCLEAGGLRGSLVMLVQIPRSIPVEILDSAQWKIVFGSGGGSLDYMIDKRIIPREAADTVEQLPPGAFCIFCDEFRWDGFVYYSPLGER